MEKDVKKISIVTETQENKDMCNILTFEVESYKMKGDKMVVKVEGSSPVENKRFHKSKLKLDGLI